MKNFDNSSSECTKEAESGYYSNTEDSLLNLERSNLKIPACSGERNLNRKSETRPIIYL